MSSAPRKTSPPRAKATAAGAGAAAAAAGADGGSQNHKITRAEVEQAFAFFDRSGSGILRPRDLKARLQPFFPHLTNKECRFLISEPNFSIDSLWKLLEGNQVTSFDACKEAFRVYDPQGTGFVDTSVLRTIMQQLGYGALDDSDLEILVRTADVDGDGRVSLADFRAMLSQNNK
jgi:Ca2+-binding EF-hand superfamily protein